MSPGKVRSEEWLVGQHQRPKGRIASLLIISVLGTVFTPGFIPFQAASVPPSHVLKSIYRQGRGRDLSSLLLSRSNSSALALSSQVSGSSKPQLFPSFPSRSII
jgi:hypothetical protein